MAKKKIAAMPPRKAKPPAKKKPVAPAESLPQKIAGAFTAVVDILTDAERLHHRLDPGISREPE